MKLDKIDVQILKLLLKDGRKSFREIAKEVGTSPPTVSAKVNQLERLGVISKYTAILNPDLLGESLGILITEKEPNLQDDIVRVCVKLTNGKYLSILCFSSLEELYSFLKTSERLKIHEFQLISDVLKKESLARVHEGMKLKIKCSYCGKVIEGEPIKASIGGRILFFCSQECARAYKSSI